MKIGAGLSTNGDSGHAAAEAAQEAQRQLDGGEASLAVVFVTPHHAPEVGAVIDAVNGAAAPAHLIGCVAESVVGGRTEVEADPGVAVWLAELPAEPEVFHMECVRTSEGAVV